MPVPPLVTVAWACLLVAGLLEPCWIITLERSDRFRKISWAAATVVIMLVSLYLLSLSMAVIGPGTAYAVWTGIGAVLTMILGIMVYDEPTTLIRIFFILMIVTGVVGLNLVSGAA